MGNPAEKRTVTQTTIIFTTFLLCCPVSFKKKFSIFAAVSLPFNAAFQRRLSTPPFNAAFGPALSGIIGAVPVEKRFQPLVDFRRDHPLLRAPCGPSLPTSVSV